MGLRARSAFWENTTAPDIRVRAAGAARRLLDHLGRMVPADAEHFQAADI